jgi:hypothetical protein
LTPTAGTRCVADEDDRLAVRFTALPGSLTGNGRRSRAEVRSGPSGAGLATTHAGRELPAGGAIVSYPRPFGRFAGRSLFPSLVELLYANHLSRYGRFAADRGSQR